MPANGSAVPQVYVTGHSLGGSVATLVAYAAQQYLVQRLRSAAAPVVSAALFAPPSVGPPQFVSSFNSLVNARRIAFEYGEPWHLRLGSPAL